MTTTLRRYPPEAKHGGVWAYSGIGWWMAGALGPIPWETLARRGPLRLLVDGPVIE